MFGKGPHGGWQDDLLAGVNCRKASIPLLLAGCADHDMGPEHLKTAEDDSGDDGSQRLRDDCATKKGSQDLEENVVDEIVSQGDLETTEASPWTSFSYDMPNGGPDLGGDWLGLDVK